MKTWQLREEIYSAAHRWYWIVLAVLAGALAGWAVSQVWPSPYRASLDLYVAIDAYRSPYDSYAANVAQQEFRMVDDYKNWQMEQLNELILTEDYLSETLARLQAENPAWDSATTADLRQMLGVMWRNAGAWHLVAEGRQKKLVVQAVRIWQGVIFERVSEAIEHARNAVGLDVQLRALSEEAAGLQLQKAGLDYAAAQLRRYQEELAQMETVPASAHWEIYGFVAQAAAWNPVWVELLSEAPTIGAPASAYSGWLAAVLGIIAVEQGGLPEKIAALETKMAAIEPMYLQETRQSKALASTLVIEPVSDEAPAVTQLRPTGTLMLIGSALGLLIWVFILFARVGRNEALS